MPRPGRSPARRSGAPVFPLSTNDLEQINSASLRILETTGVRLGLPSVLEAMKRRGCHEGLQADVVRIPRELVAECVSSAPSAVKLSDLGGRDVLAQPGGETLFWTCNALYIANSRRVRPITEHDFINWVRVTDQLENVHAAVSPTIADHPPQTRDFVGFRLLAENTTKHFRPCIYTPDGALAIMEMAQVLLGSTSLAERPIVSFGYTVTSPLSWGVPALELFEKTSGHGVPMMINAEPTAGATSPVTLAGALALANAEALSGVVITQTLEPGRPVIFNLGFAHTMDMRNAVTRTGGPENGLLGAAGAQLAAFHGLPSAAWASSESMTTDQQASAEFATVALAQATAHTNIIWGVGQLESQRTISLAQGVIDNEIAGSILRVQRGIRVDAESIAEAVITELAHKADYLSHDHTVAHFREELYRPELFYSGRRDAWENGGALTAYDRACERVCQILSAPHRPKITDEVARELRGIEAVWRERLGAL